MQESAYSNAHTGFQSSMYNDPTSFLGSTHSAAASAGMYGLASASVDSNRLSAPSAAPYLPAPLPSSSAVDDSTLTSHWEDNFEGDPNDTNATIKAKETVSGTYTSKSSLIVKSPYSSPPVSLELIVVAVPRKSSQ